jgi:uroporphyrinogen decarboxylase
MAMTSKEIVERTVSFRNPPRVARSFGDSDFVCVSLKGKVVKELLSGISRIADYKLPDYSRFEDYQTVVQARAENRDKWLIGELPGFTFSMANNIFQLENHLSAIVLQKDKVRILHNKIDCALEQMIRNFAKAGADSVMFYEDWGTQSGLLISPDLWYEEFFPRFVRLCGIAHQCGVKIFMHSCGKIAPIVPALIKAGIDVLQFDQPDLHGIDQLAEYQKQGRITFWCPVDIQNTLQSRDKKIIRAKAREMLDKLWKGRGGFIAGYYTDNAAIGLEPKWQDIACQEFLAHGKR